MMWWRFLTFCILVCIILFVVMSCIHGRPVVHLLYHKCYQDDANGQVVFEHVDSNFLRERLVGVFNDDTNTTDVNSIVNEEEEIDEIMVVLRGKLNVHDPRSRKELLEDISYDENVETESVSDGLTITSSEITTENIKHDLEIVNEVIL